MIENLTFSRQFDKIFSRQILSSDDIIKRFSIKIEIKIRQISRDFDQKKSAKWQHE